MNIAYRQAIILAPLRADEKHRILLQFRLTLAALSTRHFSIRPLPRGLVEDYRAGDGDIKALDGRAHRNPHRLVSRRDFFSAEPHGLRADQKRARYCPVYLRECSCGLEIGANRTH